MGFCDAFPVALADAEDGWPAGGARRAVYPENFFGRHAEEAAVGWVLFLFPADVLFRQYRQLGEFFQASQVGRVDGQILVELLVEAGILEDVANLTLQFRQDMPFTLCRRHSFQFG